jgi:hypothetical protein
LPVKYAADVSAIVRSLWKLETIDPGFESAPSPSYAMSDRTLTPTGLKNF